MALLKVLYDKNDDIPEGYKELYAEKNSKYELTGIDGIKTQADIDRLSEALTKERNDHKDVKKNLSVWGELKHEEVQASLDRIPELEAAAEKANDTNVAELVNNRLEGAIRTKTAPLERQLIDLTKERDESFEKVTSLMAEKITRTIHDSVRGQLVDNKVIPEAHEDALMLADRVFEIREEDGRVVTRDAVGVTPGVEADIWLGEMKDKRPHWWPPSQGGGAGGSGGGGAGGANNPWSKNYWNITEQGRVFRADGREKAEQMAMAAGSKFGSTRPPEK